MLFSIEGNIGSGKSTLINRLKEFKEISNIPVHFVDEPVNQWEMIQNEEGKNMIELFYSDPKKYSFAFQMMAYISRLVLIHKEIMKYPKDIIITERCLLTDYQVFAKTLHEKKDMLDVEFKIYQTWFYYFQEKIELTGFIYVKTDPEVAHDRCLKRARPGETIPLEYLEKCHEKHEEWFSQEKKVTLIIENNELDPDDTVWEIHDFIEDYVWEMKEPEPWHPDPFFPIWIVLIAYFMSSIILYYQTKENLNYQKMR